MRDEMDARIWVAHHDQFSETMGRFLDALGARVRRTLSATPSSGGRLASVVAAFGMTLLTLGATAA